MIEWKAVIYSVLLGLAYFIYRKYKSQLVPDAPSQPTIQVDVLNSIEELHELKKQYQNITQFIFDYRQDKDSTYLLTYIDASGTRRNAELTKTNNADSYLLLQAEQQQRILQDRLKAVTSQIDTALHQKPTAKATDKNGIITNFYQTYVKHKNNDCLSNASEESE